jgi:hypothetical protein
LGCFLFLAFETGFFRVVERRRKAGLGLVWVNLAGLAWRFGCLVVGSYISVADLFGIGAAVGWIA